MRLEIGFAAFPAKGKKNKIVKSKLGKETNKQALGGLWLMTLPAPCQKGKSLVRNDAKLVGTEHMKIIPPACEDLSDELKASDTSCLHFPVKGLNGKALDSLVLTQILLADFKTVLLFDCIFTAPAEVCSCCEVV